MRDDELFPVQRTLMNIFLQQTPPREAYMIMGRRAGKTALLKHVAEKIGDALLIGVTKAQAAAAVEGTRIKACCVSSFLASSLASAQRTKLILMDETSYWDDGLLFKCMDRARGMNASIMAASTPRIHGYDVHEADPMCAVVFHHQDLHELGVRLHAGTILACQSTFAANPLLQPDNFRNYRRGVVIRDFEVFSKTEGNFIKIV